MRPKALGVAAQELNFILDRRLDHFFGFLERDRHRLFDHDMFAGVGGNDRVRRVKSIGRRYPHRLDVGIGAKFLDAVIGLRAITFAKCFQHARVDICGGGEFELGDLLHRRQDFRRADADADDAEFELSDLGFHSP